MDRQGPVGAGSACAGEDSSYYFQEVAFPDGYDPTTVNDFSYKDALLDCKIRLFMQEEFAEVEPPQGMFQRLIKLLNSGQTKQRATTGSRLFAGLYSVISGQTLSRLVPSGIAVAILIVVGLGSSTSSLLHNGQFSITTLSVDGSSLAADTLYANEPMQAQTATTQTNPASQHITLDATGGEEAYILVRGSFGMNRAQVSKPTKAIEIVRQDRSRLGPY